MTTAEAFRAEEARHLQEAADSFERCDTDGFLSQWAHGMLAATSGGLATDFIYPSGGSLSTSGNWPRSWSNDCARSDMGPVE
jgi:hypothetical protein